MQVNASIRHPNSGNAKLRAAREAAIDAIAAATGGRASIEVRHLQYLVAVTEHLNMGDANPASESRWEADALRGEAAE